MRNRLVVLLAVGIVASITISAGFAANSGQSADAGSAGDDQPPADAGSAGDDQPPADAGSAGDDQPPADAGSAGDDQPPADAGSAGGIRFTQTVTSSQDPGLGHEDHQASFVLSPNAGTVYDGSMTFVSSLPVQAFVLHEIGPQDARGQLIWTVDGEAYYAMSLIGPQQKSGSVEFTGAALGLHSASPSKFTATVSVDGSVRGQPTGVIVQKTVLDEKEPSSLLSRTSVPVVIPMHKGIHDGGQVLYIITDGSDGRHAQMLSERQGWNVEHSPALANVSDAIPQELFVFKNGVKGDGIYGFQDEVFSATPSQGDGYAALSTVIEVSWKPGQRHAVFESAGDVTAAQEAGRIKFNETGIILNTPQVVWPDGQMAVRADGEAAGDGTVPYGGGQIVGIDRGNLTATFVAHRGWGPDGRTVYHIVTDAAPDRPAATMGVTPSPVLAEMVISPAASDLFYFKNGIRGSGQLGFQPGVTGAAPGDANYTPIWRVYLVEWHDPESARILETKSDIDSFSSDGMLSVSLARPLNSDYMVNSPLVDPFQ